MTLAQLSSLTGLMKGTHKQIRTYLLADGEIHDHGLATYLANAYTRYLAAIAIQQQTALQYK